MRMNERHWLTRRASMGGLVLVTTCMGCLQGEPESPITVERAVVDLGLIRGSERRLEQSYNLRVWGKGPVTIKDVKTICCGATPVRPDLRGMELPPNSVHTLFMSMDRGAVGPWTMVATVTTDPLAPRPITMTLSAVLTGVPVASPERLVLHQEIGETPTAKLRISYHRIAREEPLELDLEACDFAPFVVREMTCISEPVPDSENQPDPPQWDQCALDLTCDRSFPVGDHRFSLHVPLKHDLESLSVPVMIQVRHPYRPAVSEVFLGELAPGAVAQRDVALVRTKTGEIRVSSIEADKDFLHGTISQNDDAIRLTATAPSVAGRFESLVTLRFTPPEIPMAVIRVAGIVRSDP